MPHEKIYKKTEFKFLLVLLIAFFLNSCSNERIRLLGEAEEILPGTWEIVSVRLPKYGLGVTYQGHKFMADTILFNIGTIVIPEFSADTLSSKHGNHGKVRCTLSIDNEDFPYSINTLSLSSLSDIELFASWGFNGPDGAHPIITHAEQFIWSSRIFNNNYYIFLHDHDHIELGKGNDYNDHVITLRRM